MTPYAQRYATADELRLLQLVRTAVQQLPDTDLGKDESGEQVLLSCHILCRALSRVLGVPYADGHYAEVFDHSWLVTPARNIIDVYPVGVVGGPYWVDNGWFMSPGQRLYSDTRKHKYAGRFGQPSFRKAEEIVTEELRKLGLNPNWRCTQSDEQLSVLTKQLRSQHASFKRQHGSI